MSATWPVAVPCADDRSYVTGSIRGWGQSHVTYFPGGCSLEERKLTWQSPSITVEFSVQYNLIITSVIYIFILGEHLTSQSRQNCTVAGRLQKFEKWVSFVQ